MGGGPVTLSAASLTPNDFIASARRLFSGIPAPCSGEPRHPCQTCMRSIGFLAHNQPLGSKAKTFVDKDDADLLVQEMFAERLSAKLIRAFAPDSAFRRLPATKLSRFIQLPPVEIENCKFVPPSSDKRPRLSTLKAGWDWSHEAPPPDMRVSA